MDKRKAKTYRDALLSRREGLVGQVQAAEAYSRERDAEATQDPADMAANAYTKELLMSMSTNDRQLLESIDAALYRIADGDYGKCDANADKFHLAIPNSGLARETRTVAEAEWLGRCRPGLPRQIRFGLGRIAFLSAALPKAPNP